MEKISKVTIKATENSKKEVAVEPQGKARRTRKEVLASASLIRGAQYCRVCNKFKDFKEFKVTTNPFIDKNGYLSICNECLLKIFNELMQTYNDYQKAFLAFCQNVDFIYDSKYVDAAIESYNNDKRNESIITKYWRFINLNYRNQPVRYRDSKNEAVIKEALTSNDKKEEAKRLREDWGEFEPSEYAFLEKTYNEYSEHFGVNGPNERDGYKTLAILLLRQKTMPENKDIIAAIKSQYEMLGIDPKQIRKDAKEQGAMTLGLSIEKMELTDPADFFNDQDMFADVEGIRKDVNSIIRATKNFLIEGNNDFNEEDIDMNQIYDSSDSGE